MLMDAYYHMPYQRDQKYSFREQSLSIGGEAGGIKMRFKEMTTPLNIDCAKYDPPLLTTTSLLATIKQNTH